MSESVRITVLVENSVSRIGLVAEHGLSFHVQIGQRQWLFDTGQSDLALLNAETLHLPLDQVEAVVLSHGHCDHTGGLTALLDIAPPAGLFLHPAAFGEKFSRSSGQSRFIGMSRKTAQAVRWRGRITETVRWTEISEGVFATGEIPRLNDFEDTGGPFFLDEEGTKPDPLTDDQALVIDLGESLVVILGCAHAGVVNTLDYVECRTDRKPVCAVLGGFHLGNANAKRIERTISRLRTANLGCLAPMHCTGWPATAKLWAAFPEIFRPAGVGAVFEFNRG